MTAYLLTSTKWRKKWRHSTGGLRIFCCSNWT